MITVYSRLVYNRLLSKFILYFLLQPHKKGITPLVISLSNEFSFFFQSLLLFTNVIMDSAGIDYHVILAGNLFQQCLDNPGLQQELLCALCKQTSRIMTSSSKHGVQVKKQHTSIKHTRVRKTFYLVYIPFLSIPNLPF